jgi:hypothetical protein
VFHTFHVAARKWLFLVALQELRETENGVQRRTHFMAHRRQELALGLIGGVRDRTRFAQPLVRCFGSDLGLGERRLRPPAALDLPAHAVKERDQEGEADRTAHDFGKPCPCELLARSGISLGEQAVRLDRHLFSNRPHAYRKKDLSGPVLAPPRTVAALHGGVEVHEPFVDGTSERIESSLLTHVVRQRSANDRQRAAQRGVESRQRSPEIT